MQPSSNAEMFRPKAESTNFILEIGNETSFVLKCGEKLFDRKPQKSESPVSALVRPCFAPIPALSLVMLVLALCISSPNKSASISHKPWYWVSDGLVPSKRMSYEYRLKCAL